jgi:hypothetical protein
MRLRVAACLAHAVEGDARRHQLPAHDAEAPHVALFRVAVPQQHLRRRPLHRSHARHRRSAHALARQPEVRHLHPGTGRRAEQRRHAGPKEGPQRATCTPPSAETSRFCDFRSRWMIAGSRPCRYCASERGGGGGWGGAINRARLGGCRLKVRRPGRGLRMGSRSACMPRAQSESSCSASHAEGGPWRLPCLLAQEGGYCVLLASWGELLRPRPVSKLLRWRSGACRSGAWSWSSDSVTAVFTQPPCRWSKWKIEPRAT